MVSLLLSVALATDAPELRVERRATAVLGGVAVGNLATGTAGWFTAEDPTWKAFHGTNAAWNTVNLGLAAAGTVSLARRPEESLAERQARGERLHRVLAINAGLDVGYMATGAALWGVGARDDRADLTGMGSSLVFQGAFLRTASNLKFKSAEEPSLLGLRACRWRPEQ